MKKIISTMMVIVVLFNFILCNDAWAAVGDGLDLTDVESESTEGGITSDDISAESAESLTEGDGSTTDSDGTKTTWSSSSLGTNIMGLIASTLSIMINAFPVLIQATMTMLANDVGNQQQTETTGFITIERMVFDEVGMFNINYFNFDGEYTIGNNNSNTITIPEIASTLRTSVAKFYYIFRLMAAAISLVVLIYVGIRMALSTLSADKAKYKKMLIGWIESIALLFLMQYIIIFIISIGEMFNSMLYDIKSNMDASGGVNFEQDTLDRIYNAMFGKSGWSYVLYAIVFWFLIFIQTKFFVSYFKRFITVGFLILISPFITVTYPIDKIGDGKAQSFSVWFNELAINVFIQPIHALIYLVFIYTAGEIATYSIVVALIFLLAMTKVEKMVLYLFNLRNVASLKPVDDERKKKI